MTFSIRNDGESNFLQSAVALY